MAAKTVVENRKRMHMFLMSSFVHIILNGQDFVERVNSQDYREMSMKELVVMKELKKSLR